MPPFHPPPFTPLNIPAFLRDHAHLLAPPINNSLIFKDEHMTVMLVGGPNVRSDFHVNVTPEFFYQVKGGMTLRVVEREEEVQGEAGRKVPVFRDVQVGEGEMYMLPGSTPHSPIRYADTVGIVVEMTRPDGAEDALRWYCDGCQGVVHESRFVCTDLGTQVKGAVEEFYNDERLRTCESCGTVKPVPGK